MKKNGLIAVLVLMLAAAMILSGCGGAAATPTPTPEAEGAAMSSSTVAEGSVVPVRKATLGFASAGVVYEVVVDEGGPVKTGDVIVRLEGKERAEASLSAAEAELISAEQALDELNKNADVVRAAAELRLAKAEDALKEAKEDRHWKQYSHGDADQINEANARYVVAQDAVERAEEDYDSVSWLGEEDINRAYLLTVLANARKVRDKAKADLEYLQEMPDEYEVAIADAEVSVAQAEVDTAKRELEKVKDGPDPDDLALAEARLKNARAQVESAKTALKDLTVEAPFDGMVVQNDLVVGEQVTPGSSQVVVGDFSELQVETTDLSELNVVGIREGMRVQVSFDAIPDLTVGGTVERIQALGQNKQGDITYKVTVKLDEQDERLKWNMTALVTFEEQ